MDMQSREEIEWTNCWWSNANKKKERILLVGDSVLRNIRGCFEKLLLGYYAVDLFATSLFINDYLFWKHLKLFLDTSEYDYRFVIIQYGVQHGWHFKCVDNIRDSDNFRIKYVELLILLKKICSNNILMSGNSIVLQAQLNKIDIAADREIVCRNEIIKDVGLQNNWKIFDLYSIVHNAIKEYEFKYLDCVHLEKNAYYYISSCMIKFLQLKFGREFYPLAFENTMISIKHKMLNLLNNKRKILILGTGNEAKELFWILDYFLEDLVELEFGVYTETILDTEESCLGRKVNSIYNIPEDIREDVVLVFSSTLYCKEVEIKARKISYKYIRRYKDFIELLIC